MTRILKVVFTFTLFSGFTNPLHIQSFSDREILLKPIHYQLSVKVNYDNEKLLGKCQRPVFNPSDRPVKIIPLLLYRLIKVTSVQDEQGRALPFKQQVL
ncbi:MAG: hypothetical protein ACE5NG_04495 [bacterium]